MLAVIIVREYRKGSIVVTGPAPYCLNILIIAEDVRIICSGLQKPAKKECDNRRRSIKQKKESFPS